MPEEHSPGLIRHYKNLANQSNPIDSDAITARNAAQCWLDKHGYSDKPNQPPSLLALLKSLLGGSSNG